jgi:hypothetical protein
MLKVATVISLVSASVRVAVPVTAVMCPAASVATVMPGPYNIPEMEPCSDAYSYDAGNRLSESRETTGGSNDGPPHGFWEYSA